MVKRIGAPLIAIILLSCRVPLLTELPAVGTVRIDVSASGAGTSRTVVPDFASSVDAINVTLTSNDGFGVRTAGSSEAPWTVTFTDVPLGSWDIAVEAFREGVPIGAGSEENRMLTDGSALFVTVPITFDVQGMNGSVGFTVSFPVSTGIDHVRGSVEETGGALTPELVPAEDRYRAVFTLDDLPTGTYSMVLTFRRGGGTGTIAGMFREKLVVRNGFESVWWVGSDGELVAERAFQADEFFENDASLSALEVAGVLPGGNFLSATEEYDPGVIPDMDSTVFTAGSSVPGQYLRYSWNGGAPAELVPGVQSPALPTAVNNELKIMVTAPDRQTEKTYTVLFAMGYSVYYDGNGSTGGNVPADAALYAAGDTVTVADNAGELVRDGYVFGGWNTAADGSGTSYGPEDSFAMGPGDVTLHAQWTRCGAVAVSFSTPEYRAVLFSVNGEIVTYLRVVKSSEPLVLSFTDSGSSVSGREWYLNEGTVPVSTMGTYSLDISANGRYAVSCTAVCNGVKYAGSLTVTVNEPLVVSYDGNGADSGMVPPNGTHSTGDTVTVSGNTGNLARSGYAWLGWSGNSAAIAPEYTGTGDETFVMGSSSVTLFAVWEDTAPPDVTGLTAAAGNGCVTLFWTPPSASDFKGVSIAYAGDVSGTATVLKGINAQKISGLTNGYTYTFTVRTFDSASNVSSGVSITGSPAE